MLYFSRSNTRLNSVVPEAALSLSSAATCASNKWVNVQAFFEYQFFVKEVIQSLCVRGGEWCKMSFIDHHDNSYAPI